jgi:hypothetical protein
MEKDHQSDQPLRTDGFQQAAVAAETEVGTVHWSEMSPGERTTAIYAQLRRLDEARCAAISFVPGQRRHHRATAKLTKDRG